MDPVLSAPLCGERGENRVSSGKDRLRVSLSDTSSSDKESRNVHRYDGPNLELITPRGIKLTSVWWVPHLSLQSSGHLRSNHTTAPYLTSKAPAALRINLPPFTSSHSATPAICGLGPSAVSPRALKHQGGTCHYGTITHFICFVYFKL